MEERDDNHDHDPKRLIRPTMMSGLCSMVPVPFLDDILLRRVRKGMVHRILREHDVALEPDAVKPVYAGTPKGCLATAVGLVFKAIKKILRKLLRTVLFFLAIRSAALEMVETFLMGRTVERCLDKGLLRDKTVSGEEALRVRIAFERALNGADRRILIQAMKSGWRRVKGVRGIGRMMMRRFGSDRSEEELQPEDLPAEEWNVVEQGGEEVTKQLDSMEVQEFLAAFDARFDRELREMPAADG